MTPCPICYTENPGGASVCRACGAALAGNPAGGYSSALRSGTRLNGGLYAVGKVLGQGGFGITYLGSDTEARRAVAIKEFFPHGCGRDGLNVQPSTALAADYTSTREKFLDEARVLTQFRHPGIVDVYATFAENNTAYMVMEYLRGGSLEGLLEKRGLVPEAEAVSYILPVGEALEVVHAANLLHRDIKPGNIMLTDDGRVVLIDFGTARSYAAGKTGRMTTMVTPGYAPLEQYGQKVRFGPFTDVYALGATLYHLLTGQMPADATDRVTGVVLKPPHELVPEVSVAISDAVMWAMQIRVDERPQTVREFVEALQGTLPGHSAITKRLPAQPPPPERERQREPVFEDASPPADAPRPAAASAWTIPDEGPYDITARGESLRWPTQCACCFEEADAYFAADHTGGDGPFFLFPETRSWDIPYCSQCLEHVRRASETPRGPGLGGTALASLVLGPAVGLLVGLGAAAASLANAAQHNSGLQELLKPTCVAVGPAVAYRGWEGNRHGFTFVSPTFTQAFLDENADKIVA